MSSLKTSQTSPLRVDSMAVPGSTGLIGMTLCPGKKQRGALTGDWDRDLETDLRVVKQFGASALVTLMEEHELERFKVSASRFRQFAGELGFEWHHLPIPDGGTPDGSFERLWTYSGTRLRSHLTNGRRIVLHCLGGLGRTGMIAARLLVEMGVEPEAAIISVRKARPNTVQEPSQERHVRSCSLVTSPATSPNRTEKMVACLLGGAVGDGFGYQVEFDSLASIRSRFGPNGLQTPVLKNGHLLVSDDTQMTLFTLEGLLRWHGMKDASAVDHIRLAYLDWLHTQEPHTGTHKPVGTLAQDPSLAYRRAPGITCLSALQSGGRGSTSHSFNDSKGCGGVMRVAPVGFFASDLSPADTFHLGAESAALTHGHPSGYLSAGTMASLIRSLLDNETLEQGLDESVRILRTWPKHEETLTAINDARRLASTPTMPPTEAVARLGGGWVGEEALAIAIYAALVGRSFVETVAIATNHDGDSDSTASIAGQIWGAWKGLEDIPHDWIMSLDIMNVALVLLERTVNSAR